MFYRAFWIVEKRSWCLASAILNGGLAALMQSGERHAIAAEALLTVGTFDDQSQKTGRNMPREFVRRGSDQYRKNTENTVIILNVREPDS